MTNRPTMTDDKRRRIHRNIISKVRETYPDAYIVAGLGWCGPGWTKAAEMEKRLCHEAGINL